jgi:hypothetical protein
MSNEHSTRLHSLCSASGAERWLNCPGSVGLSYQLPEEPASPAASEGTRAHELAEKLIRRWLDNGRKIDSEFNNFVSLQREEYEDTHHEMEGRVWSMVDYALTYVHAIVDEVEAFDKDTPVDICVEERLAFNDEMQMFGTADFFATGKRNGESFGFICDLKYGKKRVVCENNPQLAYYAVALKKESRKNLQRIKMRIVQPRIGHWFSDIEYTAAQLEDWDKKLTEGAEKALVQIGSKEPSLTVGAWCWFCPARQVCPEKIKSIAPVDLTNVFSEVTE